MAAAPTVASRLAEAGLALPPVPTALAAYMPAVRSGTLVFTSGQLPLLDGVLLASGKVGAEVDVGAARDCARQCALNALAAAATVCDLDSVVRVVKVTGYVASSPGFTGQPTVLNGASETLLTAFGEAGSHARAAVGVAELPLGSPVEVELVLEVAD
jgi:enamine deaminase RidA (YjgF/YER057c/UK114 family)